jgi:hypothetical protein
MSMAGATVFCVAHRVGYPAVDMPGSVYVLCVVTPYEHAFDPFRAYECGREITYVMTRI